MSKTIYKYPLIIKDSQEVVMQENAKIFHVGEQGGELMLWAEVDPDAPPETITILIVGTGHEIPGRCSYVGTARMPYGLVWHVYEGVVRT